MIVVTGATGRTGRRVAEILLAKGENVRAIGRDAGRLAPLVALGAEPFVCRVEDVSLLSSGLAGADAVYLVLPENLSTEDLRGYQELVSDSYAAAIRNAHVPFAVDLSSIGAQHAHGTGPIVGLHNQEEKLNGVDGLNVLHVRAAYFMENLLMNLGPVREGTLPGGMVGDVAIPWIATKDIAEYAAARLAARDFSGSSRQELHGERDISMNEAGSAVGDAIGRPVAYVQVPSAILGENLVNMGLPRKTADLLLEMWEGANAGLVAPEEPRSKENSTPTSLETFLREVFVPAYQQSGEQRLH